MGIIKKIAAIAALPVLMQAPLSMPCEAADPLSAETTGFYETWKEKYLVQNPYVTDETQYYVLYSGEQYSDTGYEVAVTVSEAHGYGMLITACMAEYDKSAKEIFDGMYRYYKAHPSGIGPNLMAWQQTDNGSAIVDSSGADSASDGDMDIAYALLLADTIWGSDGEINYKQAAVDVINDIMTYEVNKTDWIIQLGDWAWWSSEGDKYYTATRASDFLVQYMPVFAEATGDDRWMNVYESTYSIINSILADHNTGILPDFIIKDSETGEFIPAPANFLESDYDGYYYYNSCRTPWRISMDYLVNGSEDALAFANLITDFMIKDSCGDPWEVRAGYTLDGTRLENYNDLCFVAPLLVAAGCTENTQWHAAVRDTVVNYGNDVYYGDTIKMLCLIADDGGWLVPEQAEPALSGDVNGDGTVNVADIILLQKYLLNLESLSAAQAAQADVIADGTVDAFDLAALKRMVLSGSV